MALIAAEHTAQQRVLEHRWRDMLAELQEDLPETDPCRFGKRKFVIMVHKCKGF